MDLSAEWRYLSVEWRYLSADTSVFVAGMAVFVGGITVFVDGIVVLVGGKDSSSMIVASTSPVHGPAPPIVTRTHHHLVT